MKKCNRCGAENNDESNFYPNCGARLNGPKPNHSHDKNLIERFMDVNIILKWIIIIIAVFVFLVASVCIRYIFFGIPLESYTEGDATYRQSQFDSLDIVEYGSCGYTVYQCSTYDYESYGGDDFIIGVSKSILPILKSNLTLT